MIAQPTSLSPRLSVLNAPRNEVAAWNPIIIGFSAIGVVGFAPIEESDALLDSAKIAVARVLKWDFTAMKQPPRNYPLE